MLYRPLFTWLLILSVSHSCALHKQSFTGLDKYEQAVLQYDSKHYNEALQLLEEVLPTLIGKAEEASAYFYQAYANFYKKKYLQSSDRFEYFYRTFPRDHRVEEAMYMQGYALYLASPNVRLDQTVTQAAIQVLRSYLDSYPRGTYWHKASEQLGELDEKLALKAFDIAKLYYQLTHYRAAVVTLKNFQRDFPRSSYNEKVAYLKVEAQYRYFKDLEKTYKHIKHNRTMAKASSRTQLLDTCTNTDKKEDIDTAKKRIKKKLSHRSVDTAQKVKEIALQLNTAIQYCQEFLDNYAESPHTLAVGKIYESLLLANKPSLPIKHQ